MNPYGSMQVMLGAVPKEGPKVVSFNIDFSAGQQYKFDLTALQQNANISMIQTLFVDNSQSTVQLTMVMDTTNQRIIIPPQAQAYVPCILTNKIGVTIQSTSGLVIQCQALNIAMNMSVWNVNAAPTATGGILQVQDLALEAGMNGSQMNTAPRVLSGDGATYKQLFGATRFVSVDTVNTASTALIAATAGFGWEVSSLDLSFTPDAIMAAAGRCQIVLLENATVIARSSWVALPNAAPTFTAGAAPLVALRMNGLQLTSKISGSALNVQVSTALTGGLATARAEYGLSPFIGG